MVEFVRLCLNYEKSFQTNRIFLRKEGSFFSVEHCKIRADWDAAETTDMIKDKRTLIVSDTSNEMVLWLFNFKISRRAFENKFVALRNKKCSSSNSAGSIPGKTEVKVCFSAEPMKDSIAENSF